MFVVGIIMLAAAASTTVDPSVGIGIGAGAVISMLIGSIFRPIIETRLKPDNPLHDPAIRLLGVLMGIVWYAGVYVTHTPGWTWAGLTDQLLPGIIVGAGSIVVYHGVNGSAPTVKTKPDASPKGPVTIIQQP